MGDADVTITKWKLVEVGRVVLFGSGQYAGRIAAIVEIIDHKRILVDGPHSDPDKVVPRSSAALSDITLTSVVIPKFPRAARTGVLKRAWEKEEVEKKINESSWSKSKRNSELRRGLNDFERFKVMRLKKQSRYEVQRTLAKARVAAK